MQKVYKCQNKSILSIVDDSTSGTTTVNETIAPSGTRACLRAFSGFSTVSRFENGSISAGSTSTLVSVEFQDGSATTVFKFYLPVCPPSNIIDLGGNGGFGPSLHIPGPGVLFDNGLIVRMVVPANPGTGNTGGQIAALLDVVYSI